MNANSKIIVSILGAAVLAGCGAESTTNVKEPPAKPLTGQFVDSPVAGLGYRSESVADGTTNANGEYEYFRGEIITFHIGEFEFPGVPASSVLTPLNMFKADTPFNQPVANTVRLLQTLDVDGNPDNGIEISADAASAAMMNLSADESVEDFFNRPADEFAADVEPWLAAAGAGSNTLVSFDSALEHFVTYLEQGLGTLFSNAFDISKFNGVVYNPFLSGSDAVLESFNFSPADETEIAGTFTQTVNDTEVSGTYEFQFGRRALLLTTESSATYLISRSYNTVNQVYSLCVTDAASGLATAVASCDANDDAKEDLLVFAQTRAQVELEELTERANTIEPALLEEFDTDTNTFFTSGYKRLTDDPNSGALFKKTGGSPTVDPATGRLTLAGDRFSIGNAASNPDKETSSSDTYGTGVYNLSEGFTISFDVVAHTGAGSFNLYVDNNTTSQGNSVHGDASKFYGFSINDENFPQGQRFSYTYIPGEDVVTGPDLDSPDARGVLDSSVTNSFFQLRTDSSGNITIDNLTIETVADAVDLEEPTEPEEPEEPEEPAPIPRVSLPFSADYVGLTADVFSTEYQGIKDSSGADIPLYTNTGGSVNVIAEGLELDSGRFTLGNTTPGVETSGDDTNTSGVFDLSRPYNVVMDIVSASDPDGDNNFQIYVDNNTSSSSKSIHGGDSKFYSELITTLTPGTTLTVPGLLATKNSFLQLRTESGGNVVINNLRIEYINQNLLVEETFDTTAEAFFTPEYKSLPGDDTAALYSVTGGGSGITITDGQIQLDSARFTMGNTTPDVETSGDDTVTTGIYDLSRPYKVIVDIVSVSDEEANNNFQIYVDNNTSSSSKSVHGGDSKFYSEQITSLMPGETLVVEGLPATETSFLQLRTESGGIVVIDNLRIEYIETNLVIGEDFDTSRDDFFTAEYLSLPADASMPMYSVTGGGSGITITDGQIQLDSARFTLGNRTPEVESSADDTVTTGVLDLSRPYQVMMDIISVSDEEANNGFQVYVDNNTSSSSKSIHGGDSKFYSEQILSLVPGETLVIEGLVATETSFLQLRTESGGIVVIDNLRVEYLEDEQEADGVFACSSEPDLYFCDDFNDGSTDNWNILASSDNAVGAIGYFDILNDEDKNNVLRYNAGGAGGELLLIKEAAMANVPDHADYFVEARIRPRQNSTTANKQIYMMARYQSEGNWYAGGLNVQNSSASTQVEVAITTDGSISRPVQSKSPILLGEKGGVDGVWYTVRFEMIDDALTVYLNGENMGTATDSSYTSKGLIGLFTYNRSFEIDDIKVGDPSVKPIQLTLDYKLPNWDSTTTTEPLVINVAALQNDGETVDSFTASSNNSNVVSVTQDGDLVTLTPAGEGDATVTFVSGSDSSIKRTINVSIASGFVMPVMDYGSLSGKVTPTSSSTGQYTDTNLSITFDNDITLGSLGEVRIYRMSDDSIVDQLKVGTNVDVLSAPDKTRAVNYTPLSIGDDGKTLIIDPRNDVLDYGESYYVVIGDDVVTGAQLNGIDFIGLGENADWTFTTKFTGPASTDILVDDDGDADFRTVQGALTYIMANVDKDTAATVSIKDGIYTELLFLRNQNNITLQGESRDNTIVQYDNYETFNGGSSGRPVFLVESADMLVLNNFTLKNSHIRNSAYSNQAEAIYFNSPYRLVANNMNFMSEQDTLLVKGYSWFYNTLVAGNVDFIWGYPAAALFENSEIRTIGDSKNGPSETGTEGGYILQSRTPVESDPGFVFLDSEFTNGPGPIGNTVLDNSTYIARSAGKSDAFDNVTLINNKFDTHIATVGWAVQGVNGQPAPNPVEPTATSGWREYGSMDMDGNPLDISGRVGGYPLSAGEATDLMDRASIFASFNNGAGWDPQPFSVPTLPDGPVVAEDLVIDLGFAGYNFDVTGGANGMTVTVNNGVDLIDALQQASDANMPVTIYVDGTITDANSGGSGRSIDIKDMDSVSIIGVADHGEFDGIGISIRRANNIIIQNLKIHHVLTGGKDAISIEGDNGGSTTENIWIDHNELYSTLDVDKDYYDGLIDTKSGAKNITISYNYLHDHWKASLHGHTEDDSASSNTDRNITFHHNRFENIESRLPLFRYGYGHLYNNYYNEIHSTAINSRIGAELLIENNVFENTQNPIVSFYSDVIGYWNTSGNLFGSGVTWTTPADNDVVAGSDQTPTSSYVVPYDYSLDDASGVKSKVINNAGVGKLDQSSLDIPEIEDDGGSTPMPVETNVSLPYSEDFTVTNADQLFSTAYKSIPDDVSTAMYYVTGGGSGISITDGQVQLSSARFTLGNAMPEMETTEGDTQSYGVFDLSKPYRVVVDIISVDDPDGDNNFQIYVDNNTSSSSQSMHGGDSKFYQVAITEMSAGTLEVEGLLATESSFLQVRTESGGTVVIDNLRIEYTE